MSATTSRTAGCTGFGPTDQPDTSIVQGPYASINLATTDLDGAFERLQTGDAEVVQEPTERPHRIRDCSFRDPAGNLIRIQELPNG